MELFLSDFKSVRPPYEMTQEESLKLLVREVSMHTPEEILQVVCKPDAISKRGSVRLDLFDKVKNPSIEERMALFEEACRAPFEALLGEEPPGDLLHVTCTGYTAPSVAEQSVIQRGWGKATTVTHLYHMGCSAAIAALRVAKGVEDPLIVHTECCTLHFNPEVAGLDQRVIESLFADGFIRYRLGKAPGLRLIHLYEELLPSSMDAMRWTPHQQHFRMSLAREVPVHILGALDGFLKRLAGDVEMKKAHFAIHPGGPKILNYIKRHLDLSEEQIHFSRSILKEYGNMSSATLPHIWMRMLEEGVKGPIISLAFGPGLKIAGALLCG